jgi:transposase-like protein
MMLERSLSVDHTTVYRWLQADAPELEKRCKPYLRPTNDSWRVDETYIELKGEWKYLYRAVDSLGNTLDLMLSAKRDGRAAERFFRKALKASHNQEPRVINLDTVDKGRRTPAPNNLKNAAYPPAIGKLKAEETLTKTTELRAVKYLNNIVEQDHRFIKRRVNLGMGFGLFSTARRTLRGYEAMNMIRIGQVQSVERDILAQVEFVDQIFGVAV